MNREIDWTIHLVSLDPEHEALVNAHTHGMDRYNHAEFQFVLNVHPNTIAYVLNTMGRKVQAGEVFKAGDIVEDIGNGFKARLDPHIAYGNYVLRVVVQDENHCFPEDPDCRQLYKLQTADLDDPDMGSTAGKRRRY